jgi:hypothetical protein
VASGALSLPGPGSETGNRRPETDLLVGAGRRSPEWAGANLRVSGGPNDLACSRRANVNIGGCKARATSSRDLCAAQPGSSSPNSTAPNRAGTFHSVQFHPLFARPFTRNRSFRACKMHSIADLAVNTPAWPIPRRLILYARQRLLHPRLARDKTAACGLRCRNATVSAAV